MICDDNGGSLAPLVHDPVHILQPTGPTFPVHPCEHNIPFPVFLAFPPLLSDRLHGGDNVLTVRFRHYRNYDERR